MQEFHEGDLVEAAKGDESHRGRVVRRNNEPLLFDLGIGGSLYLDFLAEIGFTLTTVEKAAPTLPTEPGWYESELFPLGTEADYDPYSLATDGKWYTSNGMPLEPEGMLRQGALRRLEPVPVTAKKVLDAIRARIGSIDSAHDFQAVATQFGVTE